MPNVILTGKSPYLFKDQLKADKANKFIGRGSIKSSTNQYRIDFGNMANCGNYISTDVVFISAEGNRKGRLTPDYAEIDLAIKAGVTFITDNLSDANRAYNIGEREVGRYLLEHDYEDNGTGIWEKINA